MKVIGASRYRAQRMRAKARVKETRLMPTYGSVFEDWELPP